MQKDRGKLLARAIGLLNTCRMYYYAYYRKRYDQVFGGILLKPRSVKPTRLSNGRQCISASTQQLADTVNLITVVSTHAGRA